jgi:hypothetical protein
MLFSSVDEFRAAINAGNYSTADQLLAELRQQVEASWPKVSAEERQVIATQVLDLLTWARQVTLVKRSHAQRRLSQLTRQVAYVSAGGRKFGRLELEG